MILQTTFRSKGGTYPLTLDAEKADRNYDDENYREWFVTADDGRILDITVWEDESGCVTKDGMAEVYASQGDFEEGLLLNKKSISLHVI